MNEVEIYPAAEDVVWDEARERVSSLMMDEVWKMAWQQTSPHIWFQVSIWLK